MKILFAFKASEWLGVECLMGTMKSQGHRVALFFESGVGEHEYPVPGLKHIVKAAKPRGKLVAKAKKFDPDLICLSILTNMYPWAREIARVLKQSLGDIPIIAGGVHATHLPGHVLQNTCVDFVCRGEGEHCLTRFVQRLETLTRDGLHYREGDYHDIANLSYIKPGDREPTHNPLNELQAELDDLPFAYKQPFFDYGTFAGRLYVMAGRGCPYTCAYCYNSAWQKFYRNKGSWVRRRSVDRVIEELRHYIDRYDCKSVFFYDDIFTLNKKWLQEFAVKYTKAVGLPYKCLIHPECLDEERASLLAASGCVHVDMGVESGDEHLRKKVLNRPVKDEAIFQTVALLNKHKISFTTLNIVGLPGETKQSLVKTYRLNKKIKPRGVIVSTFYPYPGTPLFDLAKKDGYLDKAGVESITNGRGGGYKEGPVLNHSLEKDIRSYQAFLPLAVKLPPALGMFLLNRIPAYGALRILSTLFVSAPENLFIRASEFFKMFTTANFRLNRIKFPSNGK